MVTSTSEKGNKNNKGSREKNAVWFLPILQKLIFVLI